MRPRLLCRPSQGVALILTLWVLVLLTVLAGSVLYGTQTELKVSQMDYARARALALADGAIDRTVYERLKPASPTAVWRFDGQWNEYQEEDLAGIAKIRVKVLDESGRIDLNLGSPELLKGLFKSVGGLKDEEAERVVAAILDWRDSDDNVRPNGAEASEYKAAGKKYGPRNAPFETVGELGWVLGVTPEVLEKVMPALTVYSYSPGVNDAYASRLVLSAIPGVTPEQLDEFLVLREAALRDKTPVPPFVAAQAYRSTGYGGIRVHAEVTLADGVKVVRAAVVKPSGDPARALYQVFWWGEVFGEGEVENPATKK